MFWYVVQLLVQLIIAFLLGLLVGWLLWARTLRKRTQLYTRETKALQLVQDTRAVPEAGSANALEELRAQATAHAKQQAVEIRTAKAEIASLRAQLDVTSAAPVRAVPAVVSPAVAERAVASPAAVGADTPVAPLMPDELKRIEGIGPKMAQALRAAGIETFGQLAAAPQEQLQKAIDAAKLMSPSVATWATQARFLADDDEAGFAAYTGRLVGGVEPDANGSR